MELTLNFYKESFKAHSTTSCPYLRLALQKKNSKTLYTQLYSDIKKLNPQSMRDRARSLALDGLSIKNKLLSNEDIFNTPRVQFLYIHHVFDDELGAFEKLLSKLAEKHTFISYSDAADKILKGEIDRPYISISSDDGFKNNMQAAKILDKFEAKACFFINPDTIGLTDTDKLASFCRDRLSFPPVEFMTWSDVDDLLAAGHEIGSHTMGHINIAETPIQDVEKNIQESYEQIVSKCGQVEHFAFPYGRYFHFNRAAHELVFKTGYKTCATAERGCHINDGNISPQDLLIRRDHVICDWSLDHIMYFIRNNAQKASVKDNYLPYP